MEMPNVRNVLRDGERNVEYVVMAYRALTREELLMTVRLHLGQQKRRPKPGTRVTIMSVLGATPRL